MISHIVSISFAKINVIFDQQKKLVVNYLFLIRILTFIE